MTIISSLKYKQLQHMIIYFLLSISIVVTGCGGEDTKKAELPPSLGASYVIDDTLGLILYNGTDFKLSSSLVIGSETVEIDTDDNTLIKGKAYKITYKEYPYLLYRTELPVVSLDTANITILDEPKIVGDLIILEGGKNKFESLMGIEVRGGYSQIFPKQSFSLELWKDSLGSNSYKKELLNLRKDDDWILDGLWNEPLRLRDFVSHSLWLKIGRYPYADKKPNITLGIEKKFCEVFINGYYSGVYYLGEKVDRKQLKLEKYDNRLTGELYKGISWEKGVTFSGLKLYSNNDDAWNGYEAKYPKEIGEIDWGNLYDLIDFVVNSNEIAFNTSIAQKIDLENMADYYIFLNMIYATDNRGKNIYTARYDQNSTYFFVPWDMDGSFGTNWKGVRTNITDKILSNGLYDRLIHNDEFKSKVKARWNMLKIDELSVVELQNMFLTNYDYLKTNGIYEREALSVRLPQLYNDQEINFIHGWIERRFTYLDAYFKEL